MKRIHLGRHRLVTLAVVATLALGTVLMVAVVHPWRAAATDRQPNAAVVSVGEHHVSGTTDLVSANPWAANGLSPATLGNAGWGCLFVVHAVHCAPPGGLEGITSGTAETLTVLVFDTRDPAAANASFLGTEFNIRADLFHGQPCPTDPPSRQYTYLGPGGLEIGLDYYACHRFDSPL